MADREAAIAFVRKKYDRYGPPDAGIEYLFQFEIDFFEAGLAHARAEAEQDARRYRWLVDAAGRDYQALAVAQLLGQLSREIDAAIAAEETKGE